MHGVLIWVRFPILALLHAGVGHFHIAKRAGYSPFYLSPFLTLRCRGNGVVGSLPMTPRRQATELLNSMLIPHSLPGRVGSLNATVSFQGLSETWLELEPIQDCVGRIWYALDQGPANFSGKALLTMLTSKPGRHLLTGQLGSAGYGLDSNPSNIVLVGSGTPWIKPRRILAGKHCS